MIDFDNFEEYHDPLLYDQENGQYKSEIPFLLEWAAKQKGLIIDLACGTGRATIPLAEKGFELVGVDVHKGMLNEARRKAVRLPIKWVEQDCTNLNLRLKSKLIYCVGHSFQHFLTNEAQNQLLASVNRHLHSGGVFIFDTRFPNQEELLQPCTEEYWRTYVDWETSFPVDVYTVSEYDALKQIQHYITIRKYKNNVGAIIKEKRSNIRLRYTFPREMERLLTAHGFEIIDVYKDWNETVITNDSSEMVYVCKKENVKRANFPCRP